MQQGRISWSSISDIFIQEIAHKRTCMQMSSYFLKSIITMPFPPVAHIWEQLQGYNQ